MKDNLIGKTINELTIKEYIDNPHNGKYESWNTSNWVHCLCSCGKEIDLPLFGVVTERIKSCGHLIPETSRKNMEKINKEYPTPQAISLTYKGKTMNLTEWSRETGIPRTTILYRYHNKFPVEKILEKR